MMPLRQIYLPSLDRGLSVIMAAPSSAEADTHGAELFAYHNIGGNCIHLHGEGGETHSRQAAGDWLSARHLRDSFFLCTQICHDDWDKTTQQPVNRYTPEAVSQDISADLQLIGTEFLDLVYLDDNPEFPFEPIIEAISNEIASGRIRAFGVRNWAADRLRAAHAFATKNANQGVAVVITTELSLFASNCPLWAEYVPFDGTLTQAITDLNLVVLAHAGDYTLGQYLFGNEDLLARMRPEWIERWRHPDNIAIASRIQNIAAIHGSTPRGIQMAWLLSQPFPVIAIMDLPSQQTENGLQYMRGAQILLTDAELRLLAGCPIPYEQNHMES